MFRGEVGLGSLGFGRFGFWVWDGLTFEGFRVLWLGVKGVCSEKVWVLV